MSRPTASFAKRQREQIKRDKQAEKAAKRAQRKVEKDSGVISDSDETLIEESEETTEAEPVVEANVEVPVT